MNFSKWNKRITVWLLLIAGFYMGFYEYPTEYILIFLGSGLAAMGLAVWGSIKSLAKDEPPPELEEHHTAKVYESGDLCIYNNQIYECTSSIEVTGEFNPIDWKLV